MKLKKLTNTIKTIGLCSVVLAGIPTTQASDVCEFLHTCSNVPDLAPIIEQPCKAIGTCIEIARLPTLSEITNAICAKPFQSYVTTVYNQCVNDNDGANSIFTSSRNVQLAAAILTDLGVYSRSDFEGVTVTFCGAISGGDAAGMVPSPGQILLERDLQNTPPDNDPYTASYDADPKYGGITASLAHEMVHIQQIRNNGYDGFACAYSAEMLGHGGTDEGNLFEKIAYDKAREVNRLLRDYTPSKSEDQLIADFLDPEKAKAEKIAKLNGALAAINALLLDDDACSFKLSQTNVTAPNTAGTFTANVTTDAACDWKATSNVSWLTSSSSGKGNGTINYNVTPTDAYNNRTGTVTLTSSTGATQTLTVTQSPKVKPTISIANASISEGKAGTTANMTFNVTLSTPATSAISVKYATLNGTASSGSDYVAAYGTLSFAKGESTKNIVVKVNGDNVKESNETFYVTLSSPTLPYTLSTSKATGTILNDD